MKTSILVRPKLSLDSHSIRLRQIPLADRPAATTADQRQAAILGVKKFLHIRPSSWLARWTLIISTFRVQIQLSGIRTVTIFIFLNCTGSFSQWLCLQ